MKYLPLKTLLLLTALLTINNTVSSTVQVVSYANAVALATPAVVSIKTKQKVATASNHPLLQDPFFKQFFGEQTIERKPEGTVPTGSGVIINDRGYILTNNHVVRGAEEVMVNLSDGRSAKAKIIGSDSQTDLAVLKIKLKKLPVISLGNSSELRVGDVVLAIGNPFNVGQTVTQGIVSATKNSNIVGKDLGLLIENFIQTDAAINPGNSGGALIDAHGKLIGINTAIYSTSGGNHGIGFAIPIDQAKNIMQQLITTGKIARGFLGVQLMPLNDEIRNYAKFKDKSENGIYVSSVIRNSAAHKYGILPGDIITEVNNKKIDASNTHKEVTKLTPGKAYPFEVFRNGKYLTFSIVLGEHE